MRTRRLVLDKETLTELNNDELLDVMGAAALAITPVVQCVENIASLVIRCHSVFEHCPTR